MNKSYFQLWVVSLVLAGTQGVFGGTTPAPAPVSKPVPARSKFVPPTSFQEGRDPFFPESTRSFATAITTAHPTEIVTLKAPGFSEVNGIRMAIINNHTFSVGDEGDVLIPGGRVHVRCLEIRNNLIVVEANGQRREIIFGAK